LPEPPKEGHFTAAGTKGEITAAPHLAARPGNG
jgi:hypothetical protein